MADRWHGWIEIKLWPPRWIAMSARGDWHIARDFLPDDVAHELALLNFECVEYEEGTSTLKLSDSQLAGGSWAIHESGLPEALQAHGLSFVAGDDGDYGCSGCEWWWRPGMDAIEERVAASGSVVLTLSGLRALWVDDPAELLDRLRAHFALAADDPIKQTEVPS